MGRTLKIAAREYLAYLRTPGFWISMLLIPFGMAASVMAPLMAAGATPPPHVMVVDLTGRDFTPAIAAAAHRPSPRARPGDRRPAAEIAPAPFRAQDAADAGRRLRPYLVAGPKSGSPAFDAAVVLHGRDEAVQADLWTRNPNDTSLEPLIRDAVGERMQDDALRRAGLAPAQIRALDGLQPKVIAYSPRAAGGKVGLRERLPGLVGLGMGMLLWLSVLSSASVLLNSVIEEKSSRIMEMLLASASAGQLMSGKILGVAGVSATVLGVWIALGGAALANSYPSVLADLVAAATAHGMFALFAVYLIGGYLMYAALFTAVGAWCETAREAQTLLAPVIILMSVPILFLSQTIIRPDAPVLHALAWVPPFTPFLAPARAAADPPAWETAAMALMTAITAGASVWLSARAFRAGALSGDKATRAAFFSRFFGG